MRNLRFAEMPAGSALALSVAGSSLGSDEFPGEHLLHLRERRCRSHGTESSAADSGSGIGELQNVERRAPRQECVDEAGAEDVARARRVDSVDLEGRHMNQSIAVEC